MTLRQGAQKATDAINSLGSKWYRTVREVTDVVERLIVVPGVRYDPQVLTYYLRCLPTDVKNKLVDKANVDVHNFASFNKNALEIEAKLGSAHQGQVDSRREKLPQDWRKKGNLMFVDHDGQATEIDDFPEHGEDTEQDGSCETSDVGVVAPIKEKPRGAEKQKVARSKGQGDQGMPAWVKLGLDYEDMPRQEGHHEGSLSNSGGLIFEPWWCFCEHFTRKHLGPVGVLVALTRAEVVTLPSPLQASAKASDPSITLQIHPSMLYSRDVSESLEEFQSEWSRKNPKDSWVMISKGPGGEHFVVEVDVGGHKVGAFANIGSTRNFINRAYVDKLRLGDQVQRLSRSEASTLANTHNMVVRDYVKDVVCTFSYGGGELRHKIPFLVSDKLPFDMLLGMYYLEVAQRQFDWDRKVMIHKLPNGRTVRLQKFKSSSLVENYGCVCASSFYNYYKQNREEGMYLFFVSEKGEAVKSPPEIEAVVAQYLDLF
ncbi:hypothetical protein CBR_g37773 [Chara braunii]|uniref:Uncharacterized protein n=1 Tax=Chara braunii TaxID=69332 RepID=A0A388LNW2_CHABU|nr:hypothetical protein CBR_g37773 [Chara braunii]|eukprot:GBG83902.1 hypothetical protein CBR_g37773 [Chara braunii]